MTRTDALTVLNACFPTKVINTIHNATKGFERDFYVIREQLLMAILLNYNQCVWKSFVDDPDKFQKKYQKSELLKEAGKKAVSEFFKKDSITIPAEKIHKGITNEKQMHDFALTYYEENADHTFSDIHCYAVVPFDDFWNICCDIAEIPKDTRETAEYSLAKVDAFIYFLSLYPFYGHNIKHWEKDLSNAEIEIHTRKELAVQIDNQHGGMFDYIPEGGLHGTYFKCSLLNCIFDKCKWSIDTMVDPEFKVYHNWDWHLELPASLMFNPTNKVIKRIVSSIFSVQSQVIRVMSSEKDFWGNNWVDTDLNWHKEKIIPAIMEDNRQMLKDLLPEILEKFLGEHLNNSSTIVPEPNEQIRIALEIGILSKYKDGYTPHASPSLDSFMDEWWDKCQPKNLDLPKDSFLARILYNSTTGELYSREEINRSKKAYREDRKQLDGDYS